MLSGDDNAQSETLAATQLFLIDGAILCEPINHADEMSPDR